MEQRPLRLGDIVDDYCTRERRITNHAIVAIVGDTIRQTRCTTCDAEHPYKGAKEPRLRKKPVGTELYDQVLAEVSAAPAPLAETVERPAFEAAADSDGAEQPPSPSEASPVAAGAPADDVWSGHRRLIRATLPRSENEPPPARPIPEFTMHQRPQARGPRPFRFHGPPNGNGNGHHGGGQNGFGQGRPSRSGRHRGKKRSR